MQRHKDFYAICQDYQKYLAIIFAIAAVVPANSLDCSSNPCMYGICVDEPTSSYRCYCIDGYTGINCEINWDDCWSNPCVNGGTCTDAIASFNCTCPEGFVGLTCEQKYSECMNYPCLNNGTCIDSNGFTCQCLEGFSGDFCEIDASVCNSTICKNAGECIEGPGVSFSCRCPEGWTGTFCEEDVNECLISACQNGGLCINIPGAYTCACLFGFTGKDCDKKVTPCSESKNPCQNKAVCLYEDAQAVCYCVPDYHGVFCELRYDDCESKYAECQNGGTCIDGINNFTCSCPGQYSGESCSVLASSTDSVTETVGSTDETLSQVWSEVWTEIDMAEPTRSSHEHPRPVTWITWASSASSASSASATSPDSEQTTSTVIRETTFKLDTNQVEGESLLPKLNDTSTAATTSTSDLAIPAEQETTRLTGANDTEYDETISSNTTVALVTHDVSEHDRSSQATKQPNSQPTSQPTNRPISQPTSQSINQPTSQPLVTMLPTEINFNSTDFTSEYITTGTDEASFTTLTDFHRSTFGTDIATEQPTTKQDHNYSHFVHNCSLDQCVNTSLCLNNSSQCDCSYENNCKKLRSIQNAAFSGKSYIRQKYPIVNGILSIHIRLKTRANSGILVHALFDDERYALLYIEAGQLKFQFSCGLQTMLFGELDTPVNNAQDVDVELRFQYIVDEPTDKCSARLLVNGTVAMSGEQILQNHESAPRFARLHLGGIPLAFSHQFPQIIMGFVGCMNLLKVNHINRDFVGDSIEAVQIEECSSFLCLSNPCKNFGACLESEGKTSCNCIAGYHGEYCERSICDENPCYLGATCLISPGINFICICPLGTHGLFCEKDITVVHPSFTVFSPGFSSYIAYGIGTSLKDSMELKLRIIPQTLEQISLIAYMGQSGSKREAPDHFSITYVRGYLMLTWDLGSGVRRIFTNTPLNIKPPKAHTLTVGRRGRDSWLHVEGVGNVTGKAAGTNTRLDVSPIMYIGGHKSKYFEKLPHDLPLHSGFSGCIYDIELRTDENVFPVTMSNPATGRGVGECHHNECSHHSCKNGAVCLNYGPSYSCVCMKDWEGPDCSTPINCTHLNSLCHK